MSIGTKMGPGVNKSIFPTEQGVFFICLFILKSRERKTLSCSDAVVLQLASSLGQSGGRSACSVTKATVSQQDVNQGGLGELPHDDCRDL